MHFFVCCFWRKSFVFHCFVCFFEIYTLCLISGVARSRSNLLLFHSVMFSCIVSLRIRDCIQANNDYLPIWRSTLSVLFHVFVLLAEQFWTMRWFHVLFLSLSLSLSIYIYIYIHIWWLSRNEVYLKVIDE